MSEEKVPTTNGEHDVSPWIIIGAAGAVTVGIASLVKMGYEMGINQARKILRRHDKDEKLERKRWKLYFKEQRKMNKEKKEGS